MLSTISAVTITKGSDTVYTVNDLKITCTLNDVSNTAVKTLLWTTSPIKEAPTLITADVFTVKTDPVNSYSSVSVLTVPADKLTVATHSFTCQITVGSSNTIISDTNLITIIDPGKNVGFDRC